MESKIKVGDIVHHNIKRYGMVVEQAPRSKYWDTQRFWKVKWLDLGVIDSLKKEGIRVKEQEEVPGRDLRLCDISQERRVLVGALHALSRKEWQSKHDGPSPDHRSAWACDGWL